MPEIAVILVTAGLYDPLRKTIACLREQTIADRLEVVIVAPDVSLVRLDPLDSNTFHSVKLVSFLDKCSLSAARAHGVRASTAPIVAFGEDHCYPERRCMEVFVERHTEGYDIVGPVLENANPGTVWSRCEFLIDYGTWAFMTKAAAVDSVPGHNSSYRREVLLNLGPDLDTLLAAETLIHWTLRDAGGTVLVDPRARAAHVNVSSMGAVLSARYDASRIFSAVWARQWPLWRRAYLALLSPVIAAKQLYKIASLRRSVPAHSLLVMQLVLCMLPCSVGYFSGFVFGAGDALDRAWDRELGRCGNLGSSSSSSSSS